MSCSRRIRVRRNAGFVVTLLTVAIVSGCENAVHEQPVAPQLITGIGESEKFPLSVAGYRRGQIVSYNPQVDNISVAYNLVSPSLQNAATIYVVARKARHPTLNGQFALEKELIEQYHSDVSLKFEREHTLVKDGVTYPALQAVYVITGQFMNREQRLSSELMLIDGGSHYIKLRSTAPADQASAALRSSAELLSFVDWTGVL